MRFFVFVFGSHLIFALFALIISSALQKTLFFVLFKRQNWRALVFIQMSNEYR